MVQGGTRGANAFTTSRAAFPKKVETKWTEMGPDKRMGEKKNLPVDCAELKKGENDKSTVKITEEIRKKDHLKGES